MSLWKILPIFRIFFNTININKSCDNINYIAIERPCVLLMFRWLKKRDKIIIPNVRPPVKKKSFWQKYGPQVFWTKLTGKEQVIIPACHAHNTKGGKRKSSTVEGMTSDELQKKFNITKSKATILEKMIEDYKHDPSLAKLAKGSKVDLDKLDKEKAFKLVQDYESRRRTQKKFSLSKNPKINQEDVSNLLKELQASNKDKRKISVSKYLGALR